MSAGRRIAQLEAAKRRRLAPDLLVIDSESIEAMTDDERQALRDQVIAAQDNPASTVICILDENGPHPYDLLEIHQ